MTYVRIGLRCSGKLLRTIFCLCKYSFSPFRLFLPLRRCPFLMRGLLRKSRTTELLLLFPPPLPSEGRDERGAGLGMPLYCFPRVFLSSHSTFVQREGWRSLWLLVRCTRARFCLLGSFVGWGFRSCSFAAESCFPLCLSWLSLLISARPAR